MDLYTYIIKITILFLSYILFFKKLSIIILIIVLTVTLCFHTIKSILNNVLFVSFVLFNDVFPYYKVYFKRERVILLMGLLLIMRFHTIKSILNC